MDRAVKDKNICSVLRILKTGFKLLVCGKENTRQKEIVHQVDPETKQQKQSFEFHNIKTCQLHQLGIQVFNEIDNVTC